MNLFIEWLVFLFVIVVFSNERFDEEFGEGEFYDVFVIVMCLFVELGEVLVFWVNNVINDLVK